MIFIKLLLKIRIFFFLILFITITAQGNAENWNNPDSAPLIHHLPIPSAITHDGIDELCFDQDGILYLSSGNTIWIYDGLMWHEIYTGGLTNISVLEAGEIFYSEDSKLFKENIHSSSTTERKNIPVATSENDTIINLFAFQGRLIIVFKDRLSYLDGDNREKIITGIEKGTRIFPVSDNIFLNLPGNTRRISPSFKVLNVPEIHFQVSSIKDHPLGYVILPDSSDRTWKIYSEDFNYIEKLEGEFPAGEIISFDGNELAVLSADNNIQITDLFGKVKESIRNSNIENSEQFRLIKSPAGDLWQISDNNIYISRYPWRIKKINFGENLYIFDICSLYDSVYFATSKGLISLHGGRLLNEDSRIHSLASYTDFLFFLSDSDLSVYHARNKSIKPVLSAEEIGRRSMKNNFIYRNDSVYLFQYFNFVKNRFENVFQERLNKECFLIFPFLYNISEDKLEMINIPNETRKTISLRQIEDSEGKFQLTGGSKGLYGYTSREVYHLDNQDTVFSEIEFELPGFMEIERMDYLDARYLLGKIRSSTFPGSFFILDTEKRETEYFNIPSFRAYYSDYRVLNLDSSSFILASSREVFRIKKTLPARKYGFTPVLYRIVAGEDTLLDGISYRFVAEELDKQLKNIPRSAGNLRLKISSTDYLNQVRNYQFRREGEKEWSGWQQGDEITIKDLRQGEHRLYIRMMNPEGSISNILEVPYATLKPVFLSWYAYLFYLLLAIIVFFLIYKRIMMMRNRIRKHEAAGTRVKAFHREEPEGMKKQGQSRGIAERKTKWDKYQMVTVLFSDIQGFTKIAEQMNPEHLIDELDRFFFHFDSVVENHGIEKIKTIGDAYMAAGGIPRKNRSNPVEVVLAALEMQRYMQHLQETKVDFWDLRIGIHTGPVIAGIVGQKKRSYDIWGDTVNTASRMESSGEAGKVNISGETHQLVKDYFLCEYRGRLPVKYKGNLDMYFVKGLRPELSIDLGGIPNRKFFLKLQLLRLLDLEELVFQKLDEETPEKFYFHTPGYARHIYNFAELISKAENLDVEETLLIRTATLMVPLGFTINYLTPELEASLLCQKILPEFHYSEKQIVNISKLVLSFRYPPEPRNLLEKIMVDIRHEYLGRADYPDLQRMLFREMNEFHKKIHFGEWKEQQLHLLKDFSFFTDGARRLTEVSFETQIERIGEDNLEE